MERGFENEHGANHCFLNATIHALWNIRSFRRHLLDTSDHWHDLDQLTEKEALASTGSIVAAANVPLDGSTVASTCLGSEIDAVDEQSPNNAKTVTEHDGHLSIDVHLGLMTKSCCYCAKSCCYCALKTVFKEYRFSKAPTLPLDVLRNALSSAYTTQGRFRLGEMADATETLEALFDCLHASHLCSCIAEFQHNGSFNTPEQACVSELGSLSPMSRLPSPLVTPLGKTLDNLSELFQLGDDAECVEAASDFACTPPCIAHELFGIEYIDLSRCTFCKATGEPVIEVAGSPFLYRVYVAEVLRIRERVLETTSREWMNDVESAWTLVEWMSHAKAVDLQDLLRGLCQRTVEGKCSECNSMHTVVSERWLTKSPQVFIISLVWPTELPSNDMLLSLLQLVKPHLWLDGIFGMDDHVRETVGEDPCEESRCHILRGMICYHGSHYITLCWCPPRKKWLFFNDARVQKEGDWKAACSLLISGSYMPTLLFYEKLDVSDPQGVLETLKNQMGDGIPDTWCVLM